MSEIFANFDVLFYINYAVIAILALAAWLDFKKQDIPHWIPPMIVAVFAIAFATNNLQIPFSASFLSILIIGVTTFILYSFKLLSWEDMLLMSTTMLFVAPNEIPILFSSFLVTFLPLLVFYYIIKLTGWTPPLCDNSSISSIAKGKDIFPFAFPYSICLCFSFFYLVEYGQPLLPIVIDFFKSLA